MKKVIFYTMILSTLLLASCATTANYSVLRPADLDLNGANTISVLPVKPSRRLDISIKSPRNGQVRNIFDFFDSYIENKYDEQKIMNYIQQELENGLSKSEYLKLVDSEEVENALRRRTANRLVDVYFAAEIIKFDFEDEKIVHKKKTDTKTNSSKKPVVDGGKIPVYDGGKVPVTDGNKIPVINGKTPIIENDSSIEIKYKRHVLLEYVYEIIDADTDEVISYRQVEIREKSSEYNNSRNLPEPFYIIKSKLDKSINSILHSIQPYTEYRSLSLMSNRHEKDLFKKADNYVEAGDFENAYKAYYEIYSSRKVFEAGYNAALLLEAQEKYEDALDLMDEVYSYASTNSQSKKAMSAISDIKNEYNRSLKLKGQIKNQKDRSEKF